MTAVFDGILLPYGCNKAELPEHLRQRFVELGLDDSTRSYLRDVLANRHGALKTALHRVVRQFLSDFDTNGVLGMYRMHLLSTEHFRALLDGATTGSLLDVGAGSGDVTCSAAPLFERVVTTELSRPMSRRLRERGFECHAIDLSEVDVPGAPYDVVTCLNVVDRCDRPRTLLRRLRGSLAEDGRLVVAVALPFSPCVYDGPTTRDPVELLSVGGSTWEERVRSFDREVLAPLELEVRTLARVPYLSAGDSKRRLYVLDDAVFVCGPTPDGPSSG